MARNLGFPRMLNESDVEAVALEWLRELGWGTAHGSGIGPEAERAERGDYSQVVLEGRLREALGRLNPELPPEALDDALRRLIRPEGSSLEARNRAFHKMLVDGMTVEYRTDGGSIRGGQARVLDFDEPDGNDWLAVNQVTVVENRNRRRADVVLFVNGLPLGIVELKNPADEDATIRTAWQQLQTYKAELPALFSLNEILIVSDGPQARVGTLTGGWEWFKPWRPLAGDTPAADRTMLELQVLLEGVCDPETLLALIRDFIVFDDDGAGPPAKKMAGYHQLHAVRAAVDETLRAAALQQTATEPAGARTGADAGTRAVRPAGRANRPGGRPGDRRIGVVWHTQGSGKSLTMAFYAGAIVRSAAMANPTVVVLTDRNDLDDQLFGAFSRCSDLLGQPPVQADSRSDLRDKLTVQSGGVVFTTIQKFLPSPSPGGDARPALSERGNIVVIADEAHRSQYDFIDGFARHMRDALPNASFIGFTGTPVESADANTRAVFGDYISVYDIEDAVADGATVPIYYESRLAELGIDEAQRPTIDDEFEEVTEGEEAERSERLKTRWAQLEAVVGAERRLGLVAADIVEHFERRLEVLDGKAMVVAMSRRICVELHDEIARLRPGWVSGDDAEGAVKVVMTGSAADPPHWQPHIRGKAGREALARRFRDPADPLRMVLVRDMWLTGFDAPSLHTMYADKPMRGHGLMQAIARVNRVFGDKPGGLVVDYLGLAPELKQALAVYTGSGGAGQPAIDHAEAVALMREKYEVCCGLFAGFDWSGWTAGGAGGGGAAGSGDAGDGGGGAGGPQRRLKLLPAALEHVLAQPDGKDRCLVSVQELSRAFALAVPSPEALAVRDDVAFFQAVRATLAKRTPGQARPGADLDQAVRQIVSRAVAPEGVTDIFAAAGLDRPDISVLSEEFLAEIRDMNRPNLAVELLKRLLKGQVAVRRRRNLVQSRSFSQMLEDTLRRYRNRTIEAAQVIEELLELARRMREAAARGEDLGLTEEELAFYDALETNDSAVAVLGDETLRGIARELTEKVRANVTIDWTVRESVRANLRRLVKRTLSRHGYPPDKQEKATRTVLEQAELLSETWETW